MNARTTSGVTVLLSVVLAACSTSNERAEPSGFFATHIEADGTKKFQYTMDSPFADERRPAAPPSANTRGHVSGSSSRGVSTGVSMSTASRPQGGSGGGREIYERINNDLEMLLDKSLTDTGYCRSGFRERERVIEREIIFIRGQCEDKATANERARFPND